MNCQDCQNELLQHVNLSPSAQAHLDGCAECHAFAQTLLLAVPPTPTPEVDSRVLANCRGVLAGRRQLRQRHHRQVLLGLAAAAAVLLSVALFHMHTPAPPVPRLGVPSGFDATLSDVGEFTDALSWDVGVSLSSAELDQMELDLELLTAGL